MYEQSGTMADGRYANGKIYKLVNNVDDEFYVGSTCTTLPKRYYDHKSMAKIRPNLRAYEHFNVIDWQNVQIVLVETYPCSNKMELLQRERHWIETLRPTLNVRLPSRTKKEWEADNADKVREMNAKWRAENADKERERNAKYYAENAGKVRERQARWKANNAEKVRETNAKYRARKKAEREAQQA